MADPNTPEKGTAQAASAESPTTARPLDFDDDQQESGIIQKDGTDANDPAPTTQPPRTSSMQHTVHFEEGDQPPPKPPRPLSPQVQAENTLVEAFPSIDSKVVKAVLVASGGQVEPAFNALLGMSDPDFQEEAAPPQRPPRPTPRQSQLEQDELYAQQLQAHYSQSSGPRQGYQQAAHGQQRYPQRRPQNDEEDRDYSFFDDDLPAIRENMRQGFMSTKTNINKWITDFRKRIDGEDEDEIGPGPASAQQQRQNFGSSQREQMAGIRKMSERQGTNRRRSTDQDRYDADPKVLSDNFTELELHDAEAPPPKPARPQANPDLFKPTPVAPQSGPVDEVDALYSQPTGMSPARQPSPSSGGNKSKKWQPLTSVAPNPEADDNDPFSLGDTTDDEKEKEAKSKDIRAEDTERLKKAASQGGDGTGQGEQNSASANTERKSSLEPTELSGTKDKVAEEILSGKK